MSVCLKYRTLCDAVSDFKINLTLFGGMGTSNLNFELQYVQAKKEKSFIYFYFKVISFFQVMIEVTKALFVKYKILEEEMITSFLFNCNFLTKD